MNYNNSFSKRIKSYINAVTIYKNVLDEEILNIIDELNLKENNVVLNLGAGGFHLDKFLDNKINYIPYEFSKEFALEENINYCKYDNLPFKNNSIDKIIIVALLHHFSDEERLILYKECYRILKNDGLLLVADVIKNSTEDLWLNEIVNKYNINGHIGKFFDQNDNKLFTEVGFNIENKIKKYNWNFTDDISMIDFMKKLFYLKIDNNLLMRLVKEKLNYNNCKIDWKLIYFLARKY
jgi:SAM-dependent methyltransferase